MGKAYIENLPFFRQLVRVVKVYFIFKVPLRGHLELLSSGYWGQIKYVNLKAFKSRRHPSRGPGSSCKDKIPTG